MSISTQWLDTIHIWLTCSGTETHSWSWTGPHCWASTVLHCCSVTTSHTRSGAVCRYHVDIDIDIISRYRYICRYLLSTRLALLLQHGAALLLLHRVALLLVHWAQYQLELETKVIRRFLKISHSRRRTTLLKVTTSAFTFKTL